MFANIACLCIVGSLIVVPPNCRASEFAESENKAQRIGRVLKLLDALQEVGEPRAKGELGVVDGNQRRVAREQVSTLLSQIDDPEDLGVIARLTWAVTWPGRAEQVPADLIFESAYYECIERLSRIPGSDARNALNQTALFVRPEAGEKEILSNALSRQQALPNKSD